MSVYCTCTICSKVMTKMDFQDSVADGEEGVCWTCRQEIFEAVGEMEDDEDVESLDDYLARRGVG